uniref:Uncharacterized protein n=1 Tax=Lepeophtheirus salmonis TaxID=72036 RepID=A0A0K2TCN2_LEPSM
MVSKDFISFLGPITFQEICPLEIKKKCHPFSSETIPIIHGARQECIILGAVTQTHEVVIYC